MANENGVHDGSSNNNNNKHNAITRKDSLKLLAAGAGITFFASMSPITGFGTFLRPIFKNLDTRRLAGMMLSIVGGSLAIGMSFTVIPASTQSKIDLSSGSLRLGLSLIAPIVAAFIVALKYILSIIGPQYASADIFLLVLSMAMLPTAVAMNAIAKFNNLGHVRKIIAIGVIQLAGFLTSFLILVLYYDSLGAAYSILIAYAASAIFAASMFEDSQRRYIANSVVAVFVGFIIGYGVDLMLEHGLPASVLSVVATSFVLLALRNTSVSELKQLTRGVNKSSATPWEKK